MKILILGDRILFFEVLKKSEFAFVKYFFGKYKHSSNYFLSFFRSKYSISWRERAIWKCQYSQNYFFALKNLQRREILAPFKSPIPIL